ncbi:helicase associated domain-containing protein [Streptomyces mutabilis]|uniref:helicase associated domain-containing protein n=1 Tax=Streptomyces mutabilis TaxID=67332 RepID=UPI0008FB05C1|nr:helicase associated domain-containing protein [Streptomyces mutabilis]
MGRPLHRLDSACLPPRRIAPAAATVQFAPRSCRYHAQHGNLDCTVKYVDPEGFKLGVWLANRRRRAERLSVDQRAALDALAMRW